MLLLPPHNSHLNTTPDITLIPGFKACVYYKVPFTDRSKLKAMANQAVAPAISFDIQYEQYGGRLSSQLGKKKIVMHKHESKHYC